MPCGGPSRRRLPSSMPAGYVSHTGYQYDSISRVAGQREPAPPSNFSKLGGFRSSVFITDGMYDIPPELRINPSQNTHSTAFRGSALARLFGCVLLKNLSQLPGRLEQGELGLLAGEICVQKGHPVVILVQAGTLDVLQGNAVLVEFGVLQLKRLLGKLQIEPRHFPAGLQLPHAARLLLHVEANLLPLVAELQFRLAQLALGQGYIRPSFRSKQWNGDLDTHIDVVPFEFLVKLVVIVEFAQHAVLPDQIHLWKIAPAGALEDLLARLALGCGFGEAPVVLDRQALNFSFRLRGRKPGRKRGVLRRNPD